MSDPALMYLPLQDTLDGQGRAGVVTATPTGTERFVDGGFRVEEATTNLIRNPRAGVNLTNSGAWTAASAQRITTDAPHADTAIEVTTTGVSAQGASFLTATGLNTVNADYALTAWANCPAGYSLRVQGFATFDDASQANSINNTTVASTGDWQEISVVTTMHATKTLDRFYLLVMVIGAHTPVTFLVTEAQAEQKNHATSYTDGSRGTGYAWTGTAHNSASTRAASTLTIPLSGAWGSVAFRYKEAGAWQEGYLTADGAIGTYGALAHDGSDFTISTDRQLTIGPFMAFDRELTASERDRLFAASAWSLGFFDPKGAIGLAMGLRMGL